MTTSAHSEHLAIVRQKFTNERACRAELNALHEHHPEQWRENLIALTIEKQQIAAGADPSAAARARARTLEQSKHQVRSNFGMEII